MALGEEFEKLVFPAAGVMAAVITYLAREVKNHYTEIAEQNKNSLAKREQELDASRAREQKGVDRYIELSKEVAEVKGALSEVRGAEEIAGIITTSLDQMLDEMKRDRQRERSTQGD